MSEPFDVWRHAKYADAEQQQATPNTEGLMPAKPNATFNAATSIERGPCGFCDGDDQQITGAICVDVEGDEIGMPAHFAWPVCVDCLAAPTVRLRDEGRMRPINPDATSLERRAWAYAMRHLEEGGWLPRPLQETN